MASASKNDEEQDSTSIALNTTAEKVRLFERTVQRADDKRMNFAGSKALKKEVTEQGAELKLMFKDRQSKIAAIDRILREFDFDVIHWSNITRDFKKLKEK